MRYLFWDTDFESLNHQKHKRYIIERILELGDEKAYRWMFKTYKSEEIIEAVKKSRNISRKTALMMCNFYDIPKEEVACLKTSFPIKH
ncbi:DUF6922 domain-containing protein [Pseudothermotoga thermarum]|uniref:DUF6922 domain-containing protein n=1 Tax=Pseudothermotoga thermarum TaxID=119394 RepID=UPI001B7FE9BE|nr:hypothetical protein [Pseudothermotoga thermarum]